MYKEFIFSICSWEGLKKSEYLAELGSAVGCGYHGRIKAACTYHTYLEFIISDPPSSPCLDWEVDSHAIVVHWLSCVQLICNPHALQHTRLPCPSPPLRACSDSCPLSRWCHPTISSSVIPFSSCLQSFPASEAFLMSRLFISGGQSIAASASILPMNIQDWFHLGWFGLISLQSKGLSRGFTNTTVKRRNSSAFSLF